MREYKSEITLSQNGRGMWDLDTSKGCSSGLKDNPGGCYGDCYAARLAKIYGINFSKTILRHFRNRAHERQIIKKINSINASFIRIGSSGDPSENWEHAFSIIRKISKINKEIVIITRHWATIPDEYLGELNAYKICINTSISALDEPDQLNKCLAQYKRLKPFCRSVLRIVSCDFNKANETGNRLSIIQESLFLNDLTLDTVFRPSKNSKFILDGIINVKKSKFLGKTAYISKYNKKTYLGKCSTCVEQCGVFNDKLRRRPYLMQQQLFTHP